MSNGAKLQAKLLISGLLCIAMLAAAFWFANAPGAPTTLPAAAAAAEPRILRLGLIPEKDIFTQRRGYRALADYLEKKLPAAAPNPSISNSTMSPSTAGAYRVELLTAGSYAAILDDFHEKRIDAAFLGSLTAVLAVDRYQAQVLLKSEGESGQSTYAGVVFVLDSSPAKTFADLRYKRLGAVHTTTGGAVYPVYLMKQAGMIDRAPSADAPQLVWSGTHDDVIREVVAGNLDAGAVKDLRLFAYQQAHPEVHLRILAQSDRFPDNAFVLNRDFPPDEREALVGILRNINTDPDGAAALAAMKVKRFLPCSIGDYAKLYDMFESLGPSWDQLKIPGPVPQRPAARIAPLPATTLESPHRVEGG